MGFIDQIQVHPLYFVLPLKNIHAGTHGPKVTLVVVSVHSENDSIALKVLLNRTRRVAAR